MPTSGKMDACYTGLIGAIILPEVRTISGAALAPLIISFGYNIFFSFLFFSKISNATRSFLDKD